MKGDLSHVCHPVCIPECLHGNCVRPNECECHEGYSMSNGTCLPVCDPPCENGHCSSPNQCQCDQGFQLSPVGSCIPVCNPDCLHGDCVAPNQCQCNEGFEMIDSQCSPMCLPEDCPNGQCLRGLCICNEGYQKAGDEEVCQPVCEPECPSQVCLAPNVCKVETTTSTTAESTVASTTEDPSDPYTTRIHQEIRTTTSLDDLLAEILSFPTEPSAATSESEEWRETTTDNNWHEGFSNQVRRPESSGGWLLWLYVGVAVVGVSAILGALYAKFYRQKSFNIHEADSISVIYSNH